MRHKPSNVRMRLVLSAHGGARKDPKPPPADYVDAPPVAAMIAPYQQVMLPTPAALPKTLAPLQTVVDDLRSAPGLHQSSLTLEALGLPITRPHGQHQARCQLRHLLRRVAHPQPAAPARTVPLEEGGHMASGRRPCFSAIQSHLTSPVDPPSCHSSPPAHWRLPLVPAGGPVRAMPPLQLIHPVTLQEWRRLLHASRFCPASSLL